ncbi:MAG: FHA domain-containing protein [Verrucomicrobiota bacterium]
MPFLTITSENGENVTHEISGDSVTVGRNDDNTLQLADGSLSGSHAEFKSGDDGYSLIDLDSTNGTFVGGEKITEAALADGARITFGSLDGVYTLAEPSEDDLAEASAEETAPPETGDGEIPQGESSLAAEVGDTSYRPDDFNSISPFPKRTKKKDPIATLFLAIGGVGILVSIILAVCAVIMKSS